MENTVKGTYDAGHGSSCCGSGAESYSHSFQSTGTVQKEKISIKKATAHSQSLMVAFLMKSHY